jgi:NAD(P)-dependent dehydrogenase (short-subunit alcohol dehydrogenase family)
MRRRGGDGRKVIAHHRAGARIAGVDRGVKAGDVIKVGKTVELECMDTPGHTMCHICLRSHGDPAGALLGRHAVQRRRRQLPQRRQPGRPVRDLRRAAREAAADTRVYPGHDYIENNLRFTLAREPDNGEQGAAARGERAGPGARARDDARRGEADQHLPALDEPERHREAARGVSPICPSGPMRRRCSSSCASCATAGSPRRKRFVHASRWTSNFTASARSSPAARAASAGRFARGLALEGAAVAILARDAVRLAATAAELLNETGATVVAVVADTTDEAQVERAVAEATAALGGGIDILVNAAAEPGGYAAPPRLAEIDACAAAARDRRQGDGLPALRTRGRAVHAGAALGAHRQHQRLAARQAVHTIGSIRNVAVSALTKSLADELGPSGINVTVVHPGVTRTERTAALLQARAKAEGKSEEAIEKQIAEGNSIRHLVEASEVAHVVVFLCSPKSVAIHGDAVAAGGGTPRAIHY